MGRILSGAIVIALMYGWVMNVYNLFTGVYTQNIEFVVGLVGVIAAPLGAIMGWVY